MGPKGGGLGGAIGIKELSCLGRGSCSSSNSSRAWHRRDLRYGPQTAVPQLADHAPYLRLPIYYQIPARAAR